MNLYLRYVPIAQLDRVFGYEPKGRGFESLWAHHSHQSRKDLPRGWCFYQNIV